MPGAERYQMLIGWRCQGADLCLDGFGWDPARSQELRHVRGEIDHRRFITPIGQTPPSRIMSGLPPRLSGNMLSACRADRARTVGAGRHDRSPGSLEQRECNGVVGYSHRDGLKTRTRQPGHRASSRPGQHHSQRSRPEAVRQGLRPGIEGGYLAGALGVGEMDDERIEFRALLDREDGGHGAVVNGVGTKSVHRLCGEGDQPARTDQTPPLGNRLGGCLYNIDGGDRQGPYARLAIRGRSVFSTGRSARPVTVLPFRTVRATGRDPLRATRRGPVWQGLNGLPGQRPTLM